MRILALTALILIAALSVYAFTGAGSGTDVGPGSGSVDNPADSAPIADSSTAEPSEPVSIEEPPVLAAAPELIGIDGWLQTEAGSLEEIEAPVKIVQFWTFGCYNCKNTIPHLQEIYAEFGPDALGSDGVEIIGVHAPEFEYEKDPDAIAAAAVNLGVTWPIALDTERSSFRSWQNPRRFWPRTYVLDSDNNIRFDRIGEGAYQELADTVAYLLAEAT